MPPNTAERAAATLQATFRRQRRYTQQLEDGPATLCRDEAAPADVELEPTASADAASSDAEPRSGSAAPAPAEQLPSGPLDEPTCYVCGGAGEDFDADGRAAIGLMVCRNFATCGGAKHASCCGIKMAVDPWECEPCKGRPKQKHGEPMDWSADLESVRKSDDEFEKWRAGGLACCVANICLCTVQ